METQEWSNEPRNVTDELIVECDEDLQAEYEALIKDALGKVNEQLKLNRELACDVNFGVKYSDIH